jgi:SAM-dependent methyltransferase
MVSTYSPLVKVAHQILRLPVCYTLLQVSVGAESFRNRYLNGLVKEQGHSSQFLDLGCGPGVNRKIIGQSQEYVGIDLSESYIRKAKKTYQNDANTTFIQADLVEDTTFYSEITSAHTTVALAFALWHHLSDEQVGQVLHNLYHSTEGELTISSIDPIVTQDSSPFAVWLAKNDRGPYLRSEQDFLTLYSVHGFDAETEIHRNQMRIPGNIISVKAKKK